MRGEVDVIPIQHDPVNRRFTLQNSAFEYEAPGDDIVFHLEVTPRYPNPLDRATCPLDSNGDFAADNPQYLETPGQFTERDETSRTFFKRALCERRRKAGGR